MLSGGGSLFNNPSNNATSSGSSGLFSAAANNSLLGQQQSNTTSSNNFGTNSLFGGNSSTLPFGGNSAAASSSSTLSGTNKPALGLFSNDKSAPSQDKPSSLFTNLATPAPPPPPPSQDHNAAAKPSLFASTKPTDPQGKPTSTLFGTKTAEQPVTSLFSSKPSTQPATSLFGTTPPKSNEQSVKSLFGAPAAAAAKPSGDQPVASLFGATSAPKPSDSSASSLFGNATTTAKPADKPSTSLWGASATQKPADASATTSLFGASGATPKPLDPQTGLTKPTEPEQRTSASSFPSTSKTGGSADATKVQETSLFGGGTTSLFSDPTKEAKPSTQPTDTKAEGAQTSQSGDSGTKSASNLFNKNSQEATSGADKTSLVKESEFAIEQLEQEKIEQLVSVWERKLTRQVDEFKRYSRAIVDMDATLFEYVEKIITIQKQQDRLEGRQKDLLSVIEKVEISQTAMLDTITLMEQRVRNRLPEGENVNNGLQNKASMLSHQIVDLENQVLELTKDLDRLEFKLYPEGLGQLAFLTNNHARAIERANQQTEQLSKMLLQKSRPRDI